MALARLDGPDRAPRVSHGGVRHFGEGTGRPLDVKDDSPLAKLLDEAEKRGFRIDYYGGRGGALFLVEPPHGARRESVGLGGRDNMEAMPEQLAEKMEQYLRARLAEPVAPASQPEPRPRREGLTLTSNGQSVTFEPGPLLDEINRAESNGIHVSFVCGPQQQAFLVRSADSTVPIRARHGDDIRGAKVALFSLLRRWNAEAEGGGTVPVSVDPAAPLGLQRLDPAPGREWARRQDEIARNTLSINPNGPRLIDESTFLSPTAYQALRPLVGQRDQATGLRFEATDREGFSFAFHTPTGETWFLSESPWYRDQHPGGRPFSKTRLVLQKAGEDGLVQAEFESRRALDAEGNINFDFIQQQMRTAEANRRNEQEDAAHTQELDLPHDRPIGYVGLVDKSDDPVVSGLRRDVANFPRMMNDLRTPEGQPRYHFVAPNSSEAIGVDRPPAQILRAQLQEMYDRGIRDFYLNLAGHGNDE
jgi:hypothetical protein